MNCKLVSQLRPKSNKKKKKKKKRSWDRKRIRKKRLMDGKKRLGSPLDENKDKEQRMFSPDPHFRGDAGSALMISAASEQSAYFRRDTEGAMRDTFLVDILKINGEPFKGTVPRTEA
jgi:hypothetical protein